MLAVYIPGKVGYWDFGKCLPLISLGPQWGQTGDYGEAVSETAVCFWKSTLFSHPLKHSSKQVANPWADGQEPNYWGVGEEVGLVLKMVAL